MGVNSKDERPSPATCRRASGLLSKEQEFVDFPNFAHGITLVLDCPK